MIAPVLFRGYESWKGSRTTVSVLEPSELIAILIGACSVCVIKVTLGGTGEVVGVKPCLSGLSASARSCSLSSMKSSSEE